jgi:hypothetical protein
MAGPRTSAGSPYIGAPPIKQKYPGHAVQAARIGAQCGASAYASKYVTVTDEDVDVTNLDHLLWAMLTRTDPTESIQFIAGSWDSFRPAMRRARRWRGAPRRSSGGCWMAGSRGDGGGRFGGTRRSLIGWDLFGVFRFAKKFGRPRFETRCEQPRTSP